MNNQTILRDWTIMYLEPLKADGDLIVPDNSPLTTEQIVEVLNEVKDHPNYQEQTVSVPDHEGRRTILRTRSDGTPEVITNDHKDEPHPRRMPDGSALFIKDDE